MKNKNYKQTEIGEIPENWRLTPFGEVACLSKEIFDPKKIGQEGSVVYLGLEHFCEGGFALNGVGQSDEIQSNKFRFVSSDVLFGKLRPYFKKVYSPKFDGVCSTDIWVLRAKQGVDQKFLYFLVGSDTFLNKAVESSEGTKMPRASWNFIANHKFPIPHIDGQRQIADILSSIDDKIELNKQMNKMFEEIGKALFKRWFVDFEFPDENGKPYKFSGGEMVDSELGEIPKGWKTGYLPDVVKIQKGLSYKGKDLVDKGNCALVGLKCFDRHGGFRVDGIKYYRGEYKEDHLLEIGDLVVAMTDLTQGAEVIGNPVLVPFIPNVDKAVASLDVSIIKPTSYLGQEYLYLLLTRQEAQDFLYGYTNGSTVLHLSIKGLNEFKLLIPPQNLTDRFNVLVENIFFLIRKNQHDNITLTALKNSLLPRLMSGKLRVKV